MVPCGRCRYFAAGSLATFVDGDSHGCATRKGVQATVLDALRLGLETTVLTDAVAAVDLQPDDGARALAAMQEAGASLADR